MDSLVSWCYQQQKFILSYIYYKLYVVPHALDVSCFIQYSKFSRQKYVLHGCTEVPNQIKFVSRPHPTGSRTNFIYTDFARYVRSCYGKFSTKFVTSSFDSKQIINRF
jgi:hypothetical protein